MGCDEQKSALDAAKTALDRANLQLDSAAHNTNAAVIAESGGIVSVGIGVAGTIGAILVESNPAGWIATGVVGIYAWWSGDEWLDSAVPALELAEEDRKAAKEAFDTAKDAYCDCMGRDHIPEEEIDDLLEGPELEEMEDSIEEWLEQQCLPESSEVDQAMEESHGDMVDAQYQEALDAFMDKLDALDEADAVVAELAAIDPMTDEERDRYIEALLEQALLEAEALELAEALEEFQRTDDDGGEDDDDGD